MFAVLLLSLAISRIYCDCPNGSTYNSDTNKCYYVNYDAHLWESAMQNCRNFGGDLVSIHSEEENAFILNLAKLIILQDGYAVYIGVTNYFDVNNFTWTDNSSANYSNFVNYPSYDIYTGMMVNGMWNNGFTTQHPSVCQFQPTNNTVQTNSSCPTNSTGYSGKCYHFIDGRYSFDDALEHCEAVGGDLVSVHSSQENRWISAQMKHVGTGVFWIGLNKELTGMDEYTWTDGSQMNYTNFNPDVPNHCVNGSQDCVYVEATSSQWFNCFPCSKELYAVCEVPSTTPAPTLGLLERRRKIVATHNSN